MRSNMLEFSRRTFVRASMGAAGAAALDKIAFASSGSNQSQNNSIVIYTASSALSPETPLKVLKPFLDTMRQAGISCALSTVVTREDWPTTMERIVSYSSFLQSVDIRIAKSVDDIEAAARDGKTAVVYHCRGSFMLGSPFGVSRPMVSTFNIKRISTLHGLGVRVMQITDDYKGYLGDGCSERTDCGLTDYGMWAVKTMNEQGILIDCSDAGYATSMEAINASTRPVVFSHSNAKSLCPHARNINDEQIRAVAGKEGVIGITAQPEMVDANAPNMDHFLAHIDYVTKLGGIDHVGLGFGYSDSTRAKDDSHRTSATDDTRLVPAYMSDGSQFSRIASGLRAKGYSDQNIRQISGENFLRVFRQVWKA